MPDPNIVISCEMLGPDTQPWRSAETGGGQDSRDAIIERTTQELLFERAHPKPETPTATEPIGKSNLTEKGTKLPVPEPLMGDDRSNNQVLSLTRHRVVPVLFWGLRIVLRLIYLGLTLWYAIRFYYHYMAYRVALLTKYHHRSPQLIRNDVLSLTKIPRHISVILSLRSAHIEGGGVEGLLNDVGELSSWCVGAGADELSVYERSGILKGLPLADVYRAVGSRLETYFGKDAVPSYSVTVSQKEQVIGDPKSAVLKINLLSADDGRKLIVETTRIFSQMALDHKIRSEDLTIKFVDQELTTLVGSEPDLLLMFSPDIDLQGYPPWHLRLTELFHLPDNTMVSYLVFIRALRKFSNVKINIGK